VKSIQDKDLTPNSGIFDELLPSDIGLCAFKVVLYLPVGEARTRK
jgi:hypothetical protein